MKASILALLFLSTALPVACGGDDDDDKNSSSIHADIEASCNRDAAVSKELGCSATNCEDQGADIEAAATKNGCGSQLHSFSTCLLAQPTSSFECDTQGSKAKDGICENETSAFKTCLGIK